jgi:AcrR family transcriptional regulator
MLDAAARLFGHNRFHEVRMEDIAAEAEVGKGTLYRYFMDKEELYFALLTRSSQVFVGRLEEAVAKAEGARNRLEAVVKAVLDCFDEQPHLLDLIQRAEVMTGRSTDFPWRQAREDLFRLVRDLFDAAEKEGEFAMRDPELSLLMLLGGLRSVIRYSAPPRAHDLARRIVDDLLRGADISPCPNGDAVGPASPARLTI